MQNFPAYVRFAKDGYGHDPASAVSRTDMEDGMTKQLQTKSRVLVKRPVKGQIDAKADFISWETVFWPAISKGADWFNWTDPVDGAVKTARISGGTYSARVRTAGLAGWEISFTLETWSL